MWLLVDAPGRCPQLFPRCLVQAGLPPDIKLPLLLALTFGLSGFLGAVAAAPAVVINEIMYHPPRDWDAAQWIELYNHGANPVSLDGWPYFLDAESELEVKVTLKTLVKTSTLPGIEDFSASEVWRAIEAKKRYRRRRPQRH